MTPHVTPKKMKALCITCIIFAILYASVAIAFLLLGSFCSSSVSDNVYNISYLDALFNRDKFIECAASLTGWDGISIHLAIMCAVIAIVVGLAFDLFTIVFSIVYLASKKKAFYDITIPLSSSGAYLATVPVVYIALIQTGSHLFAAFNKSASLLSAFLSNSAIMLWIFLLSPLFISIIYAIIIGAMKKVKKVKQSKAEKKAAKAKLKAEKKKAITESKEGKS